MGSGGNDERIPPRHHEANQSRCATASQKQCRWQPVAGHCLFQAVAHCDDHASETSFPYFQTLLSMKHFPFVAAVFEGGLTPAAVALGWLLGAPPLKTFRFDGHDALLGLAATLPPLGLFWLCLVCPWRPFTQMSIGASNAATHRRFKTSQGMGE